MVFETLNPTVAISLIALIILIVINAFYRFLIDQNKAKQVKDRMQELSKEAKKHRGDEAKSKELMKETMAEQNKLMKMNMKPMIASFVIVAILLPYMADLYKEHTITLSDSPSTFTISQKDYTLTKTADGVQISGDQTITCPPQCRFDIDGNVWKIRIEGNSAKLEIIAATLPEGLPLVGGWELGWIWWYIIVSIPLSLIIRALYGIKA